MKLNKLNSIVIYLNLAFTIITICYLYNDRSTVILADDNNCNAILSSEEMSDAVKNVIKNNPESIIGSLEKYHIEKQKEDLKNSSVKIKSNAKDIYDNKLNPKIGVDNTKIKLVEFFDYNCGYCRKMLAVKLQILENDKDIKIIFKELPVLGENSVELAKASLAVNILAPDKYFKFHSAILSHNGNKTKEFIESKVKDLGINIENFNKTKDSEEIKKVLESNFRLAREIGLTGSPAYIIGDDLILGSVPYTELKVKIDEQRNRTK
jgi:protein-disulfide isomerase